MTVYRREPRPLFGVPECRHFTASRVGDGSFALLRSPSGSIRRNRISCESPQCLLRIAAEVYLRGTTADFRVPISAIFFTLAWWGLRNALSQGSGGRTHASGRPPAGTTADSHDPGGAAAGSRGGLEGSIEEEPVILVGESGSGRWNIGGCAVE